MTETTYPAQFAPDNPMRRLPWVLVMAVLLVLIAMVGLGKLLQPPARTLVKPRPLQARIYELPASKGSVGIKTAPAGQRSSFTRQAVHRGQVHHSSITSTGKGASAAIPHVKRSTATDLSQASHAHQPIFAGHPQWLKQRKSPSINWANLQSQINGAVSQSESSMAQIHDPNTLLAHYYLASILEKLQRVGDMNDPTSLTGMPVISLVIGEHGELQQLSLLRSSGSEQLDHDALKIARESAPFAPFPDKLRHQTQQLKVVCYMKFVGYRQLYAGY